MRRECETQKAPTEAELRIRRGRDGQENLGLGLDVGTRHADGQPMNESYSTARSRRQFPLDGVAELRVKRSLLGETQSGRASAEMVWGRGSAARACSRRVQRP